VAPPWGTLNAINLNTGEYIGKIPLGEYPELASKGQKNTGTGKLWRVRSLPAGGSPVHAVQPTSTKNSTPSINPTASCFGEATLPFSGNATPATYEVMTARQFVVYRRRRRQRSQVALGRRSYLAFALPHESPNTTSSSRLEH